MARDGKFIVMATQVVNEDQIWRFIRSDKKIKVSIL